MAGIFDFDKTILAALETKDRRQMYEKERADRNMQWEKSFGLQQEQLNTSKYQFDEGHRQRLEEINIQIEANREQKKLDQEFTMKENNFAYLQTYEEDRGQYGELSGTLGSVIENKVNRELGDSNFDNKKWISKNAIEDYRHNQAMALEREQLGLAKWTAGKLYGDDEASKISGGLIDALYNRTSEYEPFQVSDIKNLRNEYQKKSGDIDIPIDITSPLSTSFSNPESNQKYKQQNTQLKSEFNKRIKSTYDSAETEIDAVLEAIKNSKKLEPMQLAKLSQVINEIGQKYFAPDAVTSKNDEGIDVTTPIDENYTKGLLGSLKDFSGEYGITKNYEYTNRYNKLYDKLASISSLFPAIVPTLEYAKGEREYIKK